MVIWWKWGVYYPSLAVFTVFSKPTREARAQRIRLKGRTVRLAALTASIVEFHKSQCFFMLAINIAAQVDRKAGGLQPQSLQQLYNTWVLIKAISIGGYLPVTFTLFTLHLVDVVTWYLLTLTICTVAVSIATLVTIGKFNPSDADIEYLLQSSSTNGPASCGRRTPGAWCYIPLSYRSDVQVDPGTGAYSILYFCLVVLLLLIGYQLQVQVHLARINKQLTANRQFQQWLSSGRQAVLSTVSVFAPLQRKILGLPKPQWVRRLKNDQKSFWQLQSRRLQSWRGPSWIKFGGFTKRKRTTSMTTPLQGSLNGSEPKQWSKICWKYFIVLSYLFVFIYYIVGFSIFCQDLAWFASHGVDSKTWSFGQIVAITVWAQPLCEYFHLELRESFFSRPPPPDGAMTSYHTDTVGI